MTTLPTKLTEILTDLAGTGSPVDLSVADTSIDDYRVEIYRTGGISLSRVFELESGQVAYMIDLTVINHRTRPIHLSGIELRPPWQDQLFQWLQPEWVRPRWPTKQNRSRFVYRFPRDLSEYEFSTVLNHRLVEEGKLPGQRPLAGWLLAIGGYMPAHLRHGQWVDVDIVLTTADDHEYSRTLRLLVERPDRPAKIAKPRIKLFPKGQVDSDHSHTSSPPPDDAVVSGPTPGTSPGSGGGSSRSEPGFGRAAKERQKQSSLPRRSDTNVPPHAKLSTSSLEKEKEKLMDEQWAEDVRRITVAHSKRSTSSCSQPRTS